MKEINRNEELMLTIKHLFYKNYRANIPYMSPKQFEDKSYVKRVHRVAFEGAIQQFCGHLMLGSMELEKILRDECTKDCLGE